MAAVTKINYASIVRKASASKSIGRRVHDSLLSKFEIIKDKMLDDFDNHIITRELEEEREGGSNISATLPEGYGNLFSFIGFNVEDHPTVPVRQKLEDIRFPIGAYATPFVKGGKIQFTYRIKLPTLTLNDFPSTEYPDGWRDGSWLYGIENGIPNFESYLFDENFDSYTQSRSTTGLQAKTRSKQVIIIREGAFSPVQYISKILEKFVSRLR